MDARDLQLFLLLFVPTLLYGILALPCSRRDASIASRTYATFMMGYMVGGGVCLGIYKALAGNRPYYPRRKGPYSVYDTKADGTLVWRNADATDMMETPFAGCNTVYDVFEYAIAKNGNHRAMGERDVLQSEMVGGFEKLTLSEYKWNTFNEVQARVSNVASGLVDFASLKPKDRVVIYADTKMDWQIAAQAAFSQNCSVVTIYATLGPEGVEHGINQTQATVVICDGKLLKNLTAIAKNCPTLKYVVTMGEVSQDAIAKLPSGTAHEKLSDIGARGARKPCKPCPPAPADTAIIMYTSGTTGAPKVRRCRLTAVKLVLKLPLVSAVETVISQNCFQNLLSKSTCGATPRVWCCRTPTCAPPWQGGAG